MNYLDIYFRALADYRKNTRDFRDCINQRTSTYKANPKNDILTIVRKICTVDTDWVEAIEEGMVHVEKALKEERQFIRSNGEVIPIEKVKNVSKSSVEHLAKHSNLITREVEGEDLIPDQLYTVEKLNDYAVYENRFLYMVLCYLRDFVTIRFNKILEITRKGELEVTIASSGHNEENVFVVEETTYSAKKQNKLAWKVDIETKTLPEHKLEKRAEIWTDAQMCEFVGALENNRNNPNYTIRLNVEIVV